MLQPFALMGGRTMRMAEKTSFLTRSLLLLLAVLGWNGMAAAQQPQEKRIALVVGDGAYAKSPLATAANDAGLIAQTLAGRGLRCDRRTRPRRRQPAQELPRLHGKGAGRSGQHRRRHLSRRLWRAALGRELFHSRRLQRQQRHRHPDRGTADQRLHARDSRRFRSRRASSSSTRRGSSPLSTADRSRSPVALRWSRPRRTC